MRNLWFLIASLATTSLLTYGMAIIGEPRSKWLVFDMWGLC